ncbi:MAG TPA: hypothetical protein VIJ68_02840 [Candidatus Saccharimonadales bacterium]
MSERVLIPDIYRLASPIEPDLHATFEAYLQEQGDFEAEIIKKVLRPLGTLHAMIISHTELERIHRKKGIAGEVDEAHLEDLATAVREDLDYDIQYEELEPTSWPIAEGTPKAKDSGKVLTMAQSSIVAGERSRAQQTIHDFYGFTGRLRNVWLPDPEFSRVPIITCRSQAEAEVYDHLLVLLRSDESPLPKNITLQPLRIDADLAER